MSQMLNLLKWIGKLILCYPVEISLRNHAMNGIATTFFTLLQVVFVVVGTVVAFDGMLYSPLLPPKAPLHVRIETYLFSVSGFIPDLIIRFVSLQNRREILSLCHSLSTTSVNLSIRKSKAFFIVTGNFILNAWWFIGSAITSVQMEMSYNYDRNCTYKVLPCQDYAVKCILLFFYVWDLLSSFYAWAFMVYIGFLVSETLNIFIEKLQTCTGQTRKFMTTTKTHSNEFVDVDCLVNEFHEIKSNFEKYAKIGGAYAFGLIVNYLLNSIGTVSFLLAGGSDNWFEYPLGCVTLFCFLALFAMFHFGEFMLDCVRRFRVHLYDIEAKTIVKQDDQVMRLISWLRKWDWKFYALGLFSVDFGSITGVAATVMTYFIFLFQLKMSESN